MSAGALPVPVTATWYVRCCVCLSVATVQGPVSAYFGPRPDCADCLTPLDVLGRVRGESLVHGTRCPCDDRCTGARGPICSCSCGGANHGAGLSKDIVHIVGGVPVVHLATTRDVERAKSVRDRLAVCRRVLASDPTYAAKMRGEYVKDFRRYLDIAAIIGRVNAVMYLKSHTVREKALSRIEAAIGAVGGE